ncbi:MAG: flagellin FliC [Candidatus Hydrogenedentes bacterium]|nr:flagellin FliC [Candidatus Hydrogenedentota bacterium]
MGLRINSNEPALFIQRQTQQTSNALLRGLEQLATGQRINRGADDAAGLAIVERFRAQVNQLNQEVSNLQSGVNVVQTADGALGTQEEAVQRVRELALQASNGTLTDDQRAALNQEAQQLLEQIDETAANTEFNGQTLLDGSATNVELGVEGDIEVNINESTATSLGINGVDLSTQAGAQSAIQDLDDALSSIQENRANLGAQENRFTRAIDVRETESLNTAEAESRIRDLDIARQTIEQSRNSILLQGGLAALVQSNVLGQNAARLLGS